MTVSPRAARRCTTCMPMKPAAPVTRTFMASSWPSIDAERRRAAEGVVGVRGRDADDGRVGGAHLARRIATEIQGARRLVARAQRESGGVVGAALRDDAH